MACVRCLEINPNNKDLYNDCVLECIEKIQTHYLYLKAQFQDQVQNNEKLQAKINELVSRPTDLSPKRRKTNSFDESPQLQSEKSISDCLNDAIQADLSDDSFFHGTQKQQQKHPGSTPSNVLRLSKKHSDQNTPPSLNTPQLSAAVLPRRIKSSPKEVRPRPPLAVLKTPEGRTSKWTTKTSEKKNQYGINFSFIQPADVQKRADVLSPKIAKSPGERRNLLAVNKEVNLKQSRLKFDAIKKETEQETIIPETDDTFCDMIAASPTPQLFSEADASKRKLRTVRKFYRCRPNSLAETSRKVPLNVIIKAEPQSAVKKVIDFDSKAKTLPPITSTLKVASNDESTVSGIEPIADASVCFLPSQSDDVIIVDDSNTDSNLNIDSAALFDEMMLRSDQTSDFLKRIEKKCITKLKDKTSKENETAKSSIAENVPKADLKWNCKECEKYYTMAGRIIPKDELEKHLKHCQNNHGEANCETPEGFWNPQFPPTPDDDPRYQTLVDTRIQLKKRD